ncbi:MAG: hypothetical protein PVG85_03945 [Deltaproteobacteria bacterium]|jgi:hypothetical protein
MSNELGDVLTKTGEEYREKISSESRLYLEVDIGNQGKKLGYERIKENYDGVKAIVPLKTPVAGMRVRVDGRTFIHHAQLESGIAVPGYIAKEAGLVHKLYVPNDDMILNFA